MTEMVKLVVEVAKDVAEKYNGQEIEFFKREAEAKYGKFIKAVVRLMDPSEDKEKNHLRPNVADPNMIKNLFPRLKQVFGVLQNAQILNVLNLAMSAANLAATMKGFQEINERLDRIEEQLTEIKQGIDNVQKTNFELQIAKPCRSIVSQYKDLSVLYQEGKPISEKELVALIDNSKEFIISMYNLRSVYSLQVALKMMIRGFPASRILFYLSTGRLFL